MSTPSTIIRFHNVYDLTPNYNHTRYFSSGALRDAYFNDGDHIGLELTFNQYVRIEEGKVKIPKNKADIDKYCYMSIRTSLGTDETLDRTHYCFITDVDYVSDMCTLVYFEVDVMQTFAMDGILSSSMPNYCYVKRCHEQTNTIGDNLVAEPFDISDYIESKTGVPLALFTYNIVFAVCTSRRSITFGGREYNTKPKTYYNGAYTALNYFKFSTSSPETDTDLAEFLSNFSGDQIKEIVAVYSCPSFMLSTNSDHSVGTEMPTTQVEHYEDGRDIDNGFEDYEPDNKKLFTYPYTALRVTNNEGSKMDMAFELFPDPDDCVFYIEGSFLNTPTVTCYPVGYSKYEYETTKPNYDYSVSLGDYAMGTMNIDAYASYVQTRGIGDAMKMLTSGVATLLTMNASQLGISLSKTMQGAMTVGNASGMVKTDGDYIANRIIASRMGDTANGTTTGTVSQQNNHKHFTMKTIKIRRHLAEQIDNYFTMYGYAQNKLMNIGDYLQNNTRPYYAYIQTENFLVANGGFEQKYKEKISAILNTGITFWFDTEQAVGNYSLTNEPS